MSETVCSLCKTPLLKVEYLEPVKTEEEQNDPNRPVLCEVCWKREFQRVYGVPVSRSKVAHE